MKGPNRDREGASRRKGWMRAWGGRTAQWWGCGRGVKTETHDSIDAWVARRMRNEMRRIHCGLLGGVLGACYIA